MAKPTKQQLLNSKTGDVYTWGISPSNTINVYDNVFVFNNIKYARNDGKGRESGVELLCKDIGI